MAGNTKSFFSRLTGGGNASEDDEIESEKIAESGKKSEIKQQDWTEDEEGGQLAVDMYQTPNEVVVQAMIAGVKPEDLDVSITKDMITIKGKRQRIREMVEDNYYYKELYWGSFSRSLLLPQEIDIDRIEAGHKSGLLTIHLPKINRDKIQKVRVKNE